MDYNFIILILFMFLDLIFIIEPRVPLLNLFLGLFSMGLTLTTYGIYSVWLSLFMILLTILVSFTGLQSYMKKGKKH